MNPAISMINAVTGLVTAGQQVAELALFGVGSVALLYVSIMTVLKINRLMILGRSIRRH